MKFIPDAIGRKIGESELLASENAPKVLFVGGVVGMVSSTVLACRATLKLSDALDKIENEKAKHYQAHEYVNSPEYEGEQTYDDKELKKDITVITVRGIGGLAKLYAPAVIVGGLSIAALTKSHNILQDRNVALTAAYAAVDAAYNRYRGRVVEKYGEDVDRELTYDTERIDIVNEDTGEIVSTEVVVGAPGSRYARFFDRDSSTNFSDDPEINLLFLRTVQNYMNDRLRSKGHVFLNEVFSELGLKHTTAGAVVGWRWNKDSGDDFIDFGIWDGTQEVVNDFFNGREGAILLDFNVDGIIYDKIEEGEGI